MTCGLCAPAGRTIVIGGAQGWVVKPGNAEGQCLKCNFTCSSRQRESISTLFPYYRLSLGILNLAIGAFSELAPTARLDSTERADLF